MLPTKTQTENPFVPPRYQIQAHRYAYYTRYPINKATGQRSTWRRTIRRVVQYTNLVLLGAVMMVVGGIFPLMLSYDLFFKSILNSTCDACVVLDVRSFFAVDYIIATMLAVLGFMMPIFVLVIFIHLMRSQAFRRDLFD